MQGTAITDLDLLLFTINAGYVHPAMGLWYLRSNLGARFYDYRSEATRPQKSCHGAARYSVDLYECTRRDGHDYIVGQVLSRRPRVLGVSLSIWNHTDTIAVLEAVRRHAPEVTIVIGGPEASHLPFDHPTLQLVDGVIRGEADIAFSQIAEELLDGAVVPSGATNPRDGAPALPWIYNAPLPDLAHVVLPHRLFTQHDIQRRFMYVEASRGCPFRCQFCLSSLSRGVRTAPIEPLFETIDYLLEHGADRFKFIDRTFNLDYERAATVLEFWLSRIKPGVSVQFETVPDRFPPELRDLVRRFPEGTLRLEVGVQTFNPSVANAIDRYSDQEKTIETLRFLSEETEATVHADLIVGLPGESIESFGAGFDRLYGFEPGEIQVGVLKRLHGAPIAVHDASVRYSDEPPYDVVETDWVSQEDIDRLKRFAKYWELIVNRGRFPEKIAPLLGETDATGDTPVPRDNSPFQRFLAFADFAWERFGRTWALTPEELGEAIDDFANRTDVDY